MSQNSSTLNDLRTFVAKSCLRDLRTYSANFFWAEKLSLPFFPLFGCMKSDKQYWKICLWTFTIHAFDWIILHPCTMYIHMCVCTLYNVQCIYMYASSMLISHNQMILRLFVMVVLFIGLMGRTNQTTPDDRPSPARYLEKHALDQYFWSCQSNLFGLILESKLVVRVITLIVTIMTLIESAQQ